MLKRILLLFCFLSLSWSLTAAEIPEAYQEEVRIQETYAFNPNAIRSFVFSIFFLFDKHVPVEDFLRNLVDKDLKMVFPEKTLLSPEDFKAWYAGVGEAIQSNTHQVETLEVRVKPDGTYAVHVVVLWQAVNRKGEYIKFKADQNWLLVDDNGRLKIKEYLVKAAKN
jgi:hypothetical protein